MNNKPSLISAMSTGISTRFSHWSALPLRLIVGYGFMAHGYAKLARGPEHLAAILHAIGVPFPEIMAWANIGIELLGGFAVLIGAFVTLASIPMTILLLTAILTVRPALTEKTVAGIHFVQEDSPDEIGRAVAEWMGTSG